MEESDLRKILMNAGAELGPESDDVDADDVDPECIRALCEDITNEGSFHIVKQYQNLTCIFKKIARCSPDLLLLSFKAIKCALKKIRSEIEEEDEELKKLDNDKKQELMKSVGVCFFLIYKSFTEIETRILADGQNATITTAGQAVKRRGKKQVTTETNKSRYNFWNKTRSDLTTQILLLIKYPVEYVFQGGGNFMRFLTLTFCTVVKNTADILINNKESAEEIFDIFGILASRCGEETGLLSRLIPLLKGTEDIAKVISRGIELIERKYGRCTIVPNAMREAHEVHFNQLQRETAADKGFATFIIEMTQLCPKSIITALPFVVHFLESESSTVRSAVLSSAYELLTWMKRESSDEDENLRHELLRNVLLAHMKDTNANVRNKSLQLIKKLVDNEEVHPPEAVYCLIEGKIRLLDKAVTTRKNAVSLVISIVNRYQIIVKFGQIEFRNEVGKHRKELFKLFRGDVRDMDRFRNIVVKEFIEQVKNETVNIEDVELEQKIQDPDQALIVIAELLKAELFWDACEAFYWSIRKWNTHMSFKDLVDKLDSAQLYLAFFKKIANHDAQEEEDSQSLDTDFIESDLVKSKRSYIVYLQSCQKLAQILEEVHPNMTMLLEMGGVQDKQEVISFFSAISEAGYQPTLSVTIAVIEALALVEKDKIAEFIEPFCTIFLGDEKTDVGFMKKLVAVVDKLSDAQKEHINPLIEEFLRMKRINSNCIQLLWDAFSLSTGGWESKDSSNAAYLLGIIGQHATSVVTTNLNQLINTGLGPRALDDFYLAKATCEALLLVCKKQKKPENQESVDTTIRFPSTHIVFTNLQSLIQYGLQNAGDHHTDDLFSQVVELAIQLMYKLSMEPKVLIEQLVQKIPDWVFGKENVTVIGKTERCLIRYLGVLTALLGSHIHFHETTVTAEVKGRKAIIQQKSANATDKKDKRRNRITTASRSVLSDRSAINQTTSENANEMEAIIGTIGYDMEAEVIRTYLDSLLEFGVFRQYRLHTMYICRNIAQYKTLKLKMVCVKALAKIMSVSEDSIRRSVDIFLGLWRDAEHPMVKCEIIRAAIPLNYRYPNQMEKCNQFIQSGMKDKEESVRTACIDFISYLSLNDLVKVREQLSDTAVCLCDDSHEVREMAKDFLLQCAEKDNVLTNAVPDIISRLSAREDVSQEKFHKIMKYLLTHIKKDKQVTGLVDKLVLRFKGAEKGRTCQDIAFCLAQLTCTEKSFKIIKDGIQTYSDKLEDEEVFSHFLDIIKDVRKITKGEAKARIDEYETQLNEFREKCLENERITKAAARRGVPTSPQPNEQNNSDSSMDTTGGSDEEPPVEHDNVAGGSTENKINTVNQQNKTARDASKMIATGTSDEENDDPHKSVQGGTKRNRRGAANQRNNTLRVRTEIKIEKTGISDNTPGRRIKEKKKPVLQRSKVSEDEMDMDTTEDLNTSRIGKSTSEESDSE